MVDNYGAVVVVHWGDVQGTVDSLSSVFGLCERPKWVIAVNNAAMPLREFVEILPEREILRISMVRNLGFAGGANAGYRAAVSRGAKWVWFLNNDAVPLGEAYEPLVEALSADHSVAAVSSVINSPDGVWFAGGLFRWGVVSHLTAPRQESTTETAFVTGCSLLVRAVGKDGPFREDLFMYGEDAYFSWMARRSGQHLRVATQSLVMHHVSSSLRHSNDYTYYMVRNGIIVAREISRFWPLGVLLLFKRHLLKPSRTSGAFRAGWAGLLDGLRGVTGQR